MTEESKDENIEIEEEHNEDIAIQIPFDPNDIRVKTQPLSLGQLVEMLEHKEIKLYTEFQRHPDLWNDTKKSRFIESLLLNLPIPMFYFDVQDDNLWRVIDRLQRLSTLKSFILDDGKKQLVLKGLEFLKEYEGKTYKELPRPLQRRISSFTVTAYLVEKGTPDEVKYNIFNRINQGGLILKPQEMRHALHQGVATELVADLVRGEDEPGGEEGELKATEEGKAFVKATGGKIPSSRMQDRDFATRFVAFYLLSYKSYEPTLDSFMNKGMKQIKTITEGERQELKNDFKKAMHTAWAIFGNDAFRKRFKEGEQRKPVNRALFDALSVNFAQLSEAECQALIEKKHYLKRNLLNYSIQQESFFQPSHKEPPIKIK